MIPSDSRSLASPESVSRQRWQLLLPSGDDQDSALGTLTAGPGISHGWPDWQPPSRGQFPDSDETDQPKQISTKDSSDSWWWRAVSFGREHIVLVVVALAVGSVFAITTFLHNRPSQVVAAPIVSLEPSPSLVTPTETSMPIKIHVIGAVNQPGVVTLVAGDRVQDALAAAGGLTSQADPAQLNLAAVLTDGSQIIIGTKKHPRGDVISPGGSSAGGKPGQSCVNINTASENELQSLSGVGPVMAAKIVTWREEHGRFQSVAELQEISGIGSKIFAQLQPHVCL